MKLKFSFRESHAGRPGRVDRQSATVFDVRVIGCQSRNGRRYLLEALRKAIPLYEGARVYFDHPSGDDNTRVFHERFARLVNVRADADGLIADLKYNPMHTDADQFLWFADNDPDEVGLSHNAEGRGSRDGSGEIVVEEITKVHSVDIVDGPATTFSLFEQEQVSMNDDVTAPADPTDIDAQLAELVKTIAAHPEWDKATKVAKIKDALGLMEDGAAAPDEKPLEEAENEAGDGEDMPEDEMMEQLGKLKSKAVRIARARLLRESRRTLATKRGLAADAISDLFLEQLAKVNEVQALRLIEDRRKVSAAGKAQAPKSAPPGTGDASTAAEIAARIDW